jgi:hypothetical protein
MWPFFSIETKQQRNSLECFLTHDIFILLSRRELTSIIHQHYFSTLEKKPVLLSCDLKIMKFNLPFSFAVLGLEPCFSHILGKCSTTELHP